jgi:hypothetical protein
MFILFFNAILCLNPCTPGTIFIRSQSVKNEIAKKNQKEIGSNDALKIAHLHTFIFELYPWYIDMIM